MEAFIFPSPQPASGCRSEAPREWPSGLARAWHHFLLGHGTQGEIRAHKQQLSVRLRRPSSERVKGL